MAACKHLSKSVTLYEMVAVTQPVNWGVYVGTLLALPHSNPVSDHTQPRGMMESANFGEHCPLCWSWVSSWYYVPLLLVLAFTPLRSIREDLKHTVASFCIAYTIHTFETDFLIVTASMGHLAGYIEGVRGAFNVQVLTFQ